MVDKAKSLGDTPSYENLYMFRKMVRGQSSDCLRYVHEADRIQVSVDYRRDEVQPDQLRPLFIGCTQEFTQASGMTYQHTEIVPYMTLQTSQISRYPNLSALDNIFGGYPPQHFESAPNFTSSPVPMSIDIQDATNNLENLNTEMKDNELDDTNNEVNGNNPEDASTSYETIIQHDELSKKEKSKIIAKLCGTVPPDTVSVNSLGKRSTAEEQIKKKNPAIVKISPWTLARLNSEDVLKAAAENSPACRSKELHWFHCKLKSILFSYGIS
ncbi:hypothetical protein CQW23_01957 [Capsicum baccatum]|uniref:Uncharacterized protein n=1 Tax=Capsicum baccatum TaxID=33114 RepID=A0A2G2XQ33_CAPBA|nr:hypothetical protein CQW23_01957 [Capsicum baccatum]